MPIAVSLQTCPLKLHIACAIPDAEGFSRGVVEKKASRRDIPSGVGRKRKVNREMRGNR